MDVVELCVVTVCSSPFEAPDVDQHFHDFHPREGPSPHLLHEVRQFRIAGCVVVWVDAQFTEFLVGRFATDLALVERDEAVELTKEARAEDTSAPEPDAPWFEDS